MTENSLPKLIVDNHPIPFIPGESALIAMLRADCHPTGGGCLCLAGDCPHCLATVDGVSYVRTCQTSARPGMVVQRHHADGAYPPLPLDDRPAPAVAATNLFCDVVIIGMGESGQTAAAQAVAMGQEVITLDAGAGQEVIGIYPGALVVARTDAGMLHVHARQEIVVATGAAEIPPVAPGNHLPGIVTGRAAAQLVAAGIELGRVVAVGTPVNGIDAELVTGEIVAFEGAAKVEAVVVRQADGGERRIVCDTVAVNLGLTPRDGLVRMTNGTPERAIMRVVGDAASEAAIPPCPLAGIVCHCSGVTVNDLDFIWQRGFHEMELVKRATLAGTGSCQGSACLPHLRAFLADRGGELQPPFTARPVTRQLTIGEVSAGAHHHATPRTALDAEHRKLGARMERVGGWWRPWNYGNVLEEYWAVRAGVSIGDVSTLGKMQISGPDALELLERLYPTQVATIKAGRSRYVLLLDERGYVMDDGLICKDGDTRYTLTFTSGGATFAELWVRDWAESWGLDVRILNQTLSLGAINVTGPLAAELLARAGLTNPPPYMGQMEATVAGAPCRVYRLSFTGELSYELHHDSIHSSTLWNALLALGADMGIKPHGIEALLKLRLEKGHILVGQDSDFDSTPRRLQHEWAVKLEKPNFVGRQALLRTNKIPLDKQLVGLEMDGPAPIEGAVIWHNDVYAGYVTSSSLAPALGKVVMLGWLRLFDGVLPEVVTIDGRAARRAATPFYDVNASRARAKVTPTAQPVDFSTLTFAEQTAESNRQTLFQQITMQRIVALPATLDAMAWPEENITLRIAPDELLTTAEIDAGAIADPHAIVVIDTGFSGLWSKSDRMAPILAHHCEWELPHQRPAFAQGLIAGLPVKLWLAEEEILVLVPTPLATELEERLF